jgi:hypothetical protein
MNARLENAELNRTESDKLVSKSQLETDRSVPDSIFSLKTIPLPSKIKYKVDWSTEED